MKKFVLASVAALSFCSVANAQIANAQAPQSESSTRLAQNDYVTLRLKLKPGSNYLVTQVFHASDTNVFAAEGKQKSSKIATENDATYVSMLSVLWINRDGTTQIRLVYQRISRAWKVFLGNDNQSFPDLGRNDDPKIGQPLEMRVSPDGAVSNVRGWDKILDKMPPADLSPDNATQTRQQKRKTLKAKMTDSFIQPLMQKLFIPRAKDPISLGFSWQNPSSDAQFLPFRVTYTLQGRANGLSSIAQTAKWTSGDSAPSSSQSGSLSGQIILDEATGFPKTARQELRFFKSESQRNGRKTARVYGLWQTTVTVEKQ